MTGITDYTQMHIQHLAPYGASFYTQHKSLVHFSTTTDEIVKSWEKKPTHLYIRVMKESVDIVSLSVMCTRLALHRDDAFNTKP